MLYEVITVAEEKNLLKGEKELVTEETEKVRASIETINKDKKAKEVVRKDQAAEIKKNLLKKYDILRSRSVITSYSIHYTKLYDCRCCGAASG